MFELVTFYSQFRYTDGSPRISVKRSWLAKVLEFKGAFFSFFWAGLPFASPYEP